jgi:hypothetical protein
MGYFSFLAGGDEDDDLLSRLIARFRPKRPLSYRELLAEKARLKQTIMHWQYPDGSFVAPKHRQHLMNRFHKVLDAIDRHPDNPHSGHSWFPDHKSSRR